MLQTKRKLGTMITEKPSQDALHVAFGKNTVPQDQA